MFFFFLLLALNFGISWWNAKTVGSVWSESKKIGGSMRLVAVCGYIMAIAGFTMVYGSLLLLLTIGLYPTIPWLYTHVELAALVQLTSDLFYILLVITIIPTGLVLWLNSLVVFWRQRTFGSGLTAGYNTYAMARNVVNASRELPGAFGRVTKTLFGGKKKGKEALILVAILIVVLAVCGGWMTASAIMKKSDREYDLFAYKQ